MAWRQAGWGGLKNLLLLLVVLPWPAPVLLLLPTQLLLLLLQRCSIIIEAMRYAFVCRRGVDGSAEVDNDLCCAVRSVLWR